MPISVLVTDGEQRAALAAVRSLGRAGYTVVVAASLSHSLAGASRYAAQSVRVPDPLTEPGDFAAAIQGFLRERPIQVVLPITEAAILALLKVRESLDAAIPFPSAEVFRRVSDKAAVMTLAPEVGIAVPEQQLVLSRAEAVGLRGAEFRFPLVLKPARSVAEGIAGRVKLSVLHVADRAELEEKLDRLPEEAFPLIIQSRIVGPGVGVFLMLWDGELRALFMHRRLREKPPSGGVSVYSESVMAEPALIERSQALLDRLGWQGVAMVEYKIDAATGVPYLMEINGRLWGSLQLAVDSGVDFPSLLVASALGEHPKPVLTWRVGVRMRWEWGNIDHILARLRHSDAELSLPAGTPSLRQSLGESGVFCRRGDRLQVFRSADPVPFLLESCRWFQGKH